MNTQSLGTIERTTLEIIKNGKNISVSRVPEKLNEALLRIADHLEKQKDAIFEANKKDVEAAEARQISSAMLDRLLITERVFQQMVAGVRQVAELTNPLGGIISEWDRPNELHIQKKRVPIGLIGIIYESRPNVTVDAAVLCLKTGNAVILRGGSEAINSNMALTKAMQDGLKDAGIEPNLVQLIPSTDREAIVTMCEAEGYIDLLIPRGGEGLIRTVTKHARVPVIKHHNGICIIYVHEKANLKMAEEIIINAKCQKPSACNAVETVLVDEAIAEKFIPQLTQVLAEKNVRILGDARTQELGWKSVEAAQEKDWETEFLDYVIAIKVVHDVFKAIEHVNNHGSHHSDAIITNDEEVAQVFLDRVDSATVYWNASTRFTDGNEFGFGAEIGISTDKIHARGPMGLAELTSYKYVIRGDGQARS